MIEQCGGDELRANERVDAQKRDPGRKWRALAAVVKRKMRPPSARAACDAFIGTA